MKKIGILQPGYLPWLGFFEQMAYVDLFVYLDSVQYTKRDWRNRNFIKAETGQKALLSVPVQRGPLGTQIHEALISPQKSWAKKHLKQLTAAYRKSPYFDDFYPILDPIITENEHTYLASLCVKLIEAIATYIQIDTKTAFSSDIPKQSTDRDQRIIDICQYFNSDLLFDGKAAAAFIDTDQFRKQGIDVVFQDYKHPTYRQQGDTFIPYLSIVDLIFNEGPNCLDILCTSKKL